MMKKYNAVGCAAIAAGLCVVSAAAQSFVDCFDNGVVAESDSISRFWREAKSADCAVSENASALILRSEGAPSRRATILSKNMDEADFWSAPVSLKIIGFSFDQYGVTAADTIFHFGFTAHHTEMAMRNMKDLFVVSFRKSGDLKLAWNTVEGVNPEDGNILRSETVSDGADVDSFDLQVNGSGKKLVWKLILGRNGKLEAFSGELSAPDTETLKEAWQSAGRSRIVLESQTGGSAGPGEYVEVRIDQVTVDLGSE
ncbi:hypothetical protein [Tichowtungia aerotolerans]|uniref:Uncharacterized protein n=1 Tax=Tichowtungia aerotolerans TaxID=2697043 RepID=A0A6P1M534_9BACT|nr:hypothetical protein [Tichowtungia aerotolerans]QHI69162.1 hypothetical protein GT409_06760 [Tichowtungia aerotolerans]